MSGAMEGDLIAEALQAQDVVAGLAADVHALFVVASVAVKAAEAHARQLRRRRVLGERAAQDQSDPGARGPYLFQCCEA